MIVDLGEFKRDLEGRKVTGMIRRGRFRPYWDRAEIEQGALRGRRLELLWVADPVALFFLQIQGSGRVRLPDGKVVRVGYAAQNGHDYTAIGRTLIDRGELAKEEVSLQTIRAWLRAHPEGAEELMNQNRSYVFFRPLPGNAPLGAEGVELTPGRSAAIDDAWLPYGLPLWLDSTVPGRARARSRGARAPPPRHRPGHRRRHHRPRPRRPLPRPGRGSRKRRRPHEATSPHLAPLAARGLCAASSSYRRSTMSETERVRLIERVRRRLEATGWPRLEMLLTILVTGAVGFVVSFLLHMLEVRTIWLRYGIAVVVAYGAFLLMLWAWLRSRHSEPEELDAWDALDIADAAGDVADSLRGFSGGGGEFGGAGASSTFETPRSTGSSGSLGFDLDLDDLVWVLLVLVALGSALVAVGWVIATAPALLAELLIDAALVAGLYRRLRREPSGRWLGTAIARTWIPILVVGASLVFLGFLIQARYPEADSIGDAWKLFRAGSAEGQG